MTPTAISRRLWDAIADGSIRTAAEAAQLVDLLADRPDAVVTDHIRALHHRGDVVDQGVLGEAGA